jgi:hypothetical protein
MSYKFNRELSFSGFGLIALALCFASCEREVSDDAKLASYPRGGDIFTDAPNGLTDAFFESFDPATGANPNGFGTDNDVAYEGTTSIRIDVPAPNDPDGGYIGGIFRDRGNGRNLTGFDALTFWVKGSTTATIGTVGFGVDFLENKYTVLAENIQLSTDWKKIVIPIPDPSKLTQERGMFLFSADTENSNGVGFTFWIDELRFEKLGNTNLLYSFILNGEETTVDGFVGASQVINQLGAVYNLANGQNRTITIAPSYFTFSSSNTSITGPFERNNIGEIFTRVIGASGQAVITAQMTGTQAQGSLTINAVGAFPHAPVPARNATNVISLFSDAYFNVPVRHYNGFFAPFQTTQGGAGNDPFNVDIQAPFANGNLDNIINYTQLNFVSIGMYETVPNVNISGMTHIHMDINVREPLNSGDYIRIQLETGTGSTPASASFVISLAALGNTDANGWVSLDIPLSSFPGLINTANLGQVFFITDNTISNIWVDNVYFFNN